MEQELAIMAITWIWLINFIDDSFHKLCDVDIGHNCQILESINHGIRMRDIESITESLLLGIVLIKGIFDVDSIVAILADCVILKSWGLAEPFINFVEIGVVIRFLLVYLVEVGFAWRNVDAFVDVVGLQL